MTANNQYLSFLRCTRWEHCTPFLTYASQRVSKRVYTAAQAMAASLSKAVVQKLEEEGKLLDSDHVRNLFSSVLEPAKE